MLLIIMIIILNKFQLTVKINLGISEELCNALRHVNWVQVQQKKSFLLVYLAI